MKNEHRPHTEPYGVLANREQIRLILDHLLKVECSEEGREYLCSIVEAGEIDIRPVGVHLDIYNAKRLSPEYLIDPIVDITVAARLSTATIQSVSP